jgi:GNAT superfamily N-acetyltransferase
MKITTDIQRNAEAAWVNLQRQMWRKLPDTLQSLKPYVYEVAGALVMMMAKSDALAVNRVLGLGISKPANTEVLDEIIALYDTAGLKRFCLYLSPAAQPSTAGRMLKARGFTPIGNHIKLFRTVKEDVALDHAVDVRRIGRAHAIDFARLVCRHYGWPEKRISWLAGMVGESGFEHFLAFEGRTPIATGMLYANGGVGVLGWAATDTKFRRHGAHTALIAARVARARELGLRWVTVETTEPVKGRPAGSFRNLVRCGFVPDAPTPCLVWQSGPTQSAACRRPRAGFQHHRE